MDLDVLERRLIAKLPNGEGTLRFVAVFARVEYALKRAGYLTKNRCGEFQPEADWDSFANDLGSKFLERVKMLDLAAALLERPPGKLIVKDGNLDYEKAQTPNDVQSLIGLVRRVRNNLFHGGKFPNPTGEMCGSERDSAFVEQALSVLHEAMKFAEGLEGRAGDARIHFDPD